MRKETVFQVINVFVFKYPKEGRFCDWCKDWTGSWKTWVQFTALHRLPVSPWISHLHFPVLLFPSIKKQIIISISITGGSWDLRNEKKNLGEFWLLEVTLQPHVLNMLRALDFRAPWRVYLISSACEELL